ncbi:aminodeoxychorismate synthase component I [Lentiprolixibacter aurantiacus]|uniref:Aminodeoxychorismate synthase component I n=1 Tax=Lentiprolixibacter aurantiacus TaxID=2993939 RepID=A0AAE3SQ19_9FLAO|nr:aminodeoxychorismate synthase component I [Lentiprolixibacter aurantiacus]MCX2720781.1 aminodeoxychorismate synthase component I [Lentiprolixibacter aurantiacus]
MFREQLNKWGKEGKPFVFLIDFEQQKPRAWLMDECPESFKYNFDGITNVAPKSNGNRAFRFDKTVLEQDLYRLKFNQVKDQLLRGNSYLVNLTVSSPLETDLTLEEIFHASVSRYKVWLKDEFVCFSPESFVQIKNNRICTFPMKGTIDADLKDARDRILADKKEQAEHATIVDLLRNDLSKVANNVTVNKYRYYEVIQSNSKKLGQVSSEICGSLPEGFASSIGDILWELLPAGSISGAPKNKTVQIIQEVEGAERGYYTGIAGYFDGKNLDSCILIRYIDQNYTYRSGGGITHLSSMEEEYQELIDKIYVPIY